MIEGHRNTLHESDGFRNVSFFVDPAKGGPPIRQWSAWGSEFASSSEKLREVAQAILNAPAVPEVASRSLLELIQYLISRKPAITLEELAHELINTNAPSCIGLAKEIREFSSSDLVDPAPGSSVLVDPSEGGPPIRQWAE